MVELCRIPIERGGVWPEPSRGMRPKQSPIMCSVFSYTLWRLCQNRYSEVQMHKTSNKGTYDSIAEFI